MAEMNEIVKLAVDNYHGCVQNYSKEDTNDVLRQALIDANGGSTKLDYRAIRDGKCNGLFTIVEDILHRTAVEGLQESDYFNGLVDFRDVSQGDQNEFVVEDDNLFVVSEVADGTQGIRRQRVGGASTIAIPTSVKAVRVYEELNRVLSGRVDINDMIDRVGRSFSQKLLEDIYSLWVNATAADLGGVVYFPTAGTYDEDDLLDLIAHVEAAAGGKTATIVGTKKALRHLAPSIQGADSKSDLYNMGLNIA